MYLYGCPTQQIADVFNALGRRSYLGNIKWTSGSIASILRNERHCGEVLTRKTYTPDYRNHLSKKNRGQRPQSHYLNHHEAIISRDDFTAVQQRLDNAKYGNRLVLPQLHAVSAGFLRGFVVIHPRWAGFCEQDYRAAAFSDTIFSLFGWDTGHKYRITGTLYEKEGETACLFGAADAEILVRAALLPDVSQPVLTTGQHIRAVPAAWMENFGESFYLHEQAAADTPEGIGIAAQPVEAAEKLHVTARDELRRYIKQELGPLFWEDTDDG